MNENSNSAPLGTTGRIPAQRLPGLDGLRGVAALVVVIHHSLTTVPVLSSAGSEMVTNPFLRVLTYTPLHIFWAGYEAVLVFFVLSGTVLARATMASRWTGWSCYYRSRLFRLYLPAWASIVWAVLLLRLFPFPAGADPSSSIEERHVELTWGLVARTSTLFGALAEGDAGTRLNDPLWSLQWEVLFSLLLPLYLFLALRSSRRATAVGLALFFATAIALRHVGGWYLLAFMGGVVLARVRPDALSGRTVKFLQSRTFGSVALFASVICLTIHWTMGLFGMIDVGGAATLPAAIIGAAVLVALVIIESPSFAWLMSPWAVFLGGISFSLYLCHDPIVLALSLTLGAAHRWVVVIVAPVLAIGAAVLFRRFIEAPSHRLARRLGKPLNRDGSDHLETERTSGVVVAHGDSPLP